MTNPGCFGSPSVFSVDSNICRNCASGAACQPKAHETLERIKNSVDVRDLIARHEKIKSAVQARNPRPHPGNPVTWRDLPAQNTKQVARSTERVKTEYEISPLEMALLEKCPDSVQKVAIDLLKKGYKTNFVAALKQHKNPFAGYSLNFIEIAGDLLLNGVFTRDDYMQRLQRITKAQEASCRSKVSIGVAVLKALMLIEPVDGTSYRVRGI